MGTFIYAPGASIIIGSARWGDIDVTDDIVSGDVSINSNRQHELNFTLENHRHKYDGVFMPNDRIVLKLKRTKWLPIMSGYLNKVPFATTWPGTVTFNASCTLKIPFYRLYDSGAIATTDLFNSFVTGDPDPQAANGDGGLGDRAKKVLTEMADWPEDKIHIGQLPSDWWTNISGLWESVRPALEASIRDTVDSTASIYGSETYAGADGATVGGSEGNPSIMGPPSLTPDELYKWYKSNGWPDEPLAGVPASNLARWYIADGNKYGVRGDLCFVQACLECGHFTSNFAKTKYAFAGIGAYDSNPGAGMSSPTPQDGVMAHVQFMKKVAMGNASIPAGENMTLNRPNAPEAIKTYISELNKAPYVYATDSGYYTKLSGMWLAAVKFSSRGFKTKGGSNTPASEDQGASSGGATGKGGGTSALAQSIGKVGTAVAGAAKTANGQWVFPVPGGKYSQDSYGQARGNNGVTSAHTHAGVDISAPQGTPIYAVVGGTAEVPPKSKSAGNYVRIRTTDGQVFIYMHMMDGGVLVQQGQVVKAGQQIGKVGATGAPNPTAYHLHFEWRPTGNLDGFEGTQNPNAMLAGGNPDGGTDATPLLSANTDTQEYSDLSASLIGPRMLLNDQGSSVLSLVNTFITAGMREYCSAPNGDFIAWFPDYFGNYGKVAKVVLEDIELTDFSINWSDDGFVTHQFVVGSVGGYHSEAPPDEAVAKMLSTMGVATIEFPEILKAIIGDDQADWMTPDAIMKRFGPRVDKQDYDAIVTPEAEFYMAVKLFMENWAKQFSASVSISFMPELWPGMLLQVPSRGIQFYVEQVSHRWSFTDGFSTTVGICAPAGMNGKFSDLLPKAGALNGALD